MADNIREHVRERYGEMAKKVEKQGPVSCCCDSSSCCSSVSNAEMLYDTDSLQDLPADAVAASLGCANPLLLAELKEGETVLDLGSGGGIDVLAASKYVGPTGKVYGLDMTDEMLELANRNKERMSASNVIFLKGYIENIPLPDNSVNVVMSNCVINLSEDKGKVLQEAYRVLKEGGRLAVADIVALKAIPDRIRIMAELWVGCLAGALNTDIYEQLLQQAGFQNINIEPVNVYTKEIVKSFISGEQNLSDFEWDMIDGAFAGAYVKGKKL
jgi:arsenite methyltransferase